MSNAPVVETPLGKVKGRCCVKPKKANARQGYRFGSIPFAKPPLGELRFEPPQKATPWDGVLDGTVGSCMPIQCKELLKDIEGFMAIPCEFEESFEDFNEDCLYLDLYTSNLEKDANRPVFVWLYGGGFQIGGAKSYDGNVLASLHDVVVVVPNYRLSAFGFLSIKGEDSPCKGNMGLLDQVMALEWVRDNVRSFGGNPDNVTIFGESAGSISVSLHVHSPMSSKLFHRAISHSGVCDFPMLMKEDNDMPVSKMLEFLKIEDKDPQVLMEKLKKLPAEDIVNAADAIIKAYQMFCPLKNDGTFFPHNLDDVMKNKSFSKVPYIFGVNNTEGCGVLNPGKDKDPSYNEGLSEKDGNEILDLLISFMAPPAKAAAVKEAIIKEYGQGMDKEKNQHFWSILIGTMNGDLNFVMSSLKSAAVHSSTNAPTYFYHMTQQPRYNHGDEYNFMGEKRKDKADFCECDHGDDLNFTFGFPLTNAKLVLDVKFTDEEVLFSEIWMKYLVNFATTGNPNEGPNQMNLEWPKYEATSKKYLESNDNPQVKADLSSTRVKFWNETFPALLSS